MSIDRGEKDRVFFGGACLAWRARLRAMGSSVVIVGLRLVSSPQAMSVRLMATRTST